MSSFAVLGGGPMGLAAALQLLKSGHSVTLFEADDRLGGMSASFDFEGTKVERYYHFLCKGDEPLFAAAKELGIEDKICWRDTSMGFYHKGKLHPWGTPWALLKFPNLSLISKIRYGLHVMATSKVSDWSKLDKVSARKWIRNWVGEEGYNVLWKSLFDLKFFEYSDNLSAAWIGTRIKRVGKSRKSMFQESLGFIEGGSDVLVNAFEKAIRKLGGNISLKTPVSEVVTSNGRVTGLRVGTSFHAFDGVVSTVPLPYVTRLVPELPTSEKNQIASIANIGVVCVLLKLKHSISPNFWTNINDSSIEIPGIIEYTNLNPIKQDEHLVYLPYYMPQSHPKYQRSREEFLAEATNYLGKLNPNFTPDWILGMHMHRYQFAQPICEPGFAEKLPPMQSDLTGFFMADTSYYYPEDRAMSESIRVGKDLSNLAAAWGHAQTTLPKAANI